MRRVRRIAAQAVRWPQSSRRRVLGCPRRCQFAQRRDLDRCRRRRSSGAKKRQIVEAARHCPAKARAHHAGLAAPGSGSRRIESGDHFRCGRCQLIQAQPRRRERGRRGIDTRTPGPSEVERAELAPGAAPPAASTRIPSVSLSPSNNPRSQDLLIGKREQTLPQGQQVAGKVPAVHRRNVDGRQRLQRLRVVPVVEVAPVPFQRFHRAREHSPCAR